MRSRMLLSVAGLTLGAALSVLSQPAMAITSFFGNGTCIALCIGLYNSCAHSDEVGHRFRRKPAGDSGGCRPPLT